MGNEFDVNLMIRFDLLPENVQSQLKTWILHQHPSENGKPTPRATEALHRVRVFRHIKAGARVDVDGEIEILGVEQIPLVQSISP